MNTNALKRFATTSRTLLIKGVKSRLLQVGFNEDGSVRFEPTMSGDQVVFNGRIVDNTDFYTRWQELRRQIERHGVKEVVEQAAYTWFNRFMAIRILDRNNLAPDILQYENPEVRLPKIVTDARAGMTPVLTEAQRTALNEVIFDGSKTYEQFSVLIQAYCEGNAILRSCFGGITDYTMLLLPPDILGEGNFIDLLNETSSLIERDDYRKPELIGWLYQFYIADKKDEVFAKKGGYESDEIPAATQIFTPNWIVKYMVENTLGRIYLDNNPGSHLAENWKYLVNPAEPTPAGAVLRYSSLEQLTCADLSCGSGHILNEMFDLLYQLYEEEFYSPREAIEAIFRKNMVGIDIDVRAQQLAMFALLLKACQRDSAFTNGYCLPRIYSFPDVWPAMWEDTVGHFNCAYQISMPQGLNSDEIVDAFFLMKDADVLGSIMKFEISKPTRDYLSQCVEAFEAEPKYEERFSPIINAYRIILALTEDYAALCMNPPYMATSKESVLAKYAKNNYPDSKADLFAVFMDVAYDRLTEKGKYGMINLPSWLFLSSFENLRLNLIDNTHIDSLIHMGRGIFGIDWGSVAFCCTKTEYNDIAGSYFRLHKRNFQHIYYFHIEELFFKALNNHSFKYNFDEYREDGEVSEDIEFISSENGLQLFYTANQKQFEQIPGSPIAYWVSEKIRETFTNNLPLSAVANPCVGLQTADNGRFVRSWFEVAKTSIGFGCESISASIASGRKFFPYNKGGESRMWYGNQDLVVNWYNDGYEIRNFFDEKGKLRSRPQNTQYYFQPSISWSKISAGRITFRYYPQGFIFDVAGTSIFGPNEDIPFNIAVLNSCVIREILKMISPTLNYEVGQIATLPITQDRNYEIVRLSQNCISISKQDWDAHETSWDFETNPLIAAQRSCGTNVADLDALSDEDREEVLKDYDVPTNSHLLSHCYKAYVNKWTQNFFRLKRNEEEINRRFIEIYGLQDELKPHVPLNEVTILQQGEIKIVDEALLTTEDGLSVITTEDGIPFSVNIKPELEWQKDVIIKQLISYAVGCMMGRYRLDRPGLAIAHPNPMAEEIAEYVVPQTGKSWWIDDDGIVPMMDDDCGFHDNASNRFSEFIEAVFGTDSKTENLNFVREALGKDIVDYFRTDFYTDHKKMYQSRPIYWMFSSNQKGKRAAFQCLVYMHRMNRFTPEHIRTNYLLPYIETLAAREADLSSRTSLTARENKQLKQIKADLEECREYQLRLHDFADQQIEIDLDDGVVKNYATFAPVLAKLK